MGFHPTISHNLLKPPFSTAFSECQQLLWYYSKNYALQLIQLLKTVGILPFSADSVNIFLDDRQAILML